MPTCATAHPSPLSPETPACNRNFRCCRYYPFKRTSTRGCDIVGITKEAQLNYRSKGSSASRCGLCSLMCVLSVAYTQYALISKSHDRAVLSTDKTLTQQCESSLTWCLWTGDLRMWCLLKREHANMLKCRRLYGSSISFQARIQYFTCMSCNSIVS